MRRRLTGRWPIAVTQDDIARKAGVDRTTVSRILTRNLRHRVSPQTVTRVLSIAKKMGYDVSRLHGGGDRRGRTRTPMNVPVKLEIRLEDGRRYDAGSGTLRDASSSGALLANVRTRRSHLPLKPFSAVITLGKGRGKAISFNAEFVRLQRNGNLEFGIEFEELSQEARELLGLADDREG